MVYLTSINILDTGYLSVSNRGSQLPSAQRVNSGTVLQLKGVEFDITTSANLDSESHISNYGDTEIPVCSVNPDEVTIRIYINTEATETNPGVWNTGDMKYLASLARLPKTRGFKAIYYPVLRTATTLHKADEQMITYLGRFDTTEVQTGLVVPYVSGANYATTNGNLTNVNYIPVRFERCKITQPPQGGIQIVLTGFRTA